MSCRWPPPCPPPLPPLEGYTFEGYRNADGSVGTQNILGITTTVQCVAPTVDYAVRRIQAEILPRFPNVDDVVAITHTYGCGVAIDAPGRRDSHPHPAPHQPARQSRRSTAGGQPGLREAAAGAAVRRRSSRFWDERQRDPPAGRARLRRDRRRRSCEAAEKRLAAARPPPAARPVPASDLVVGLQCGGSDAFSGVTCNPAVGYAADLLVRAGATVMFSEVTEVRDASTC